VISISYLKGEIALSFCSWEEKCQE